MLDNRLALSKIFSSILFLTRQGLAFRGHQEKTSNLYQFLVLRCQDVSELKNWMNREGCKWLHHKIVDKIIGLFANEIRKNILSEIKSAKYYALTNNETSDITKLEQVSICIWIVNEDLLINEYFMELYVTPNTKSDTLLKLVTEFLEKQNLDIHDLRGQCYDGASNVSGRITAGLQIRIREIEPRAVYVHCSVHCLNLSIQDSLEKIANVRNVIGIIKDCINFIPDSPKRLNEFKDIKLENTPLLSPLCPTRYIIKNNNYIFNFL